MAARKPARPAPGITIPRRRPKPEEPAPVPAPVPVPEPKPAPVPEPKPAPEARAFVLPSGPIKTPAPDGGSFGMEWARVQRWEPLFREAARTPGWDAAPLFMALLSIIESRAQHYTTGKLTGTREEVIVRGSDAYDAHPAVGIMQVKPYYHQHRVPGADAWTPEGNVRLATAILVQEMRRLGNWEAVIREVYHPGLDPTSGTSPESYIRAIRGLIAEAKRATPGAPKPGKTPGTEPPQIPVTAADALRVITGNHPKAYVSFGFNLPNLDGGRPQNLYAYGVGHGTTAAHMHSGIDIALPRGADVFCPLPGVVRCVGSRGQGDWGQGCGAFADDRGGVGNITILTEAAGDAPPLKLTFGHMAQAFVNVGQRVAAGQRIGASGAAAGFDHFHLDAAIRAPERTRPDIWLNPGDYFLIDPLPAIAGAMGGESPKPEPEPDEPGAQPPSRTGARYAVPGLAKPVHLPFPLEVALIPRTQTRQRPGTRMDPDAYVQHDTGNTNPGMGADAHKRYLQNGAPDDAGRPQSLSYHLTVDDTKAIVLIPLNEVAWHAGDGNGPCNARGIACELCVNRDADAAKARANAAILAAEIMNAAGLASEALRPHQACSGKECPRTLLNAPGGFRGFADQVSALRKERS